MNSTSFTNCPECISNKTLGLSPQNSASLQLRAAYSSADIFTLTPSLLTGTPVHLVRMRDIFTVQRCAYPFRQLNVTLLAPVYIVLEQFS